MMAQNMLLSLIFRSAIEVRVAGSPWSQCEALTGSWGQLGMLGVRSCPRGLLSTPEEISIPTDVLGLDLTRWLKSLGSTGVRAGP